MCAYVWNSLKCIRGCGSINPTVTVYEQKVQKFRSCSVHRTGGLSWSSVDAGLPQKWAIIMAEEWTYEQSERKQAKSQTSYIDAPI